MDRAAAEQEIEDYNAFQRGEGSLHRRMICLPLTEHFDPPPGQQGHGKLQVSDRISIPKELMTGVFLRKPEPPWQFVLRKIQSEEDDEDEEDEEGGGVSDGEEEDEDVEEGASDDEDDEEDEEGPKELKHLYCHVLDWQAPRNYVFVPRWMMRALRLSPREVVEVTWCRLREGAQVTLRPKTKDFSSWANPQAVMESELKYYSSLTVGSTIMIGYKGSEHALEVAKVMAGEQQLDGANIQDVNVAVDFTGLPSRKKETTHRKANLPKSAADQTTAAAAAATTTTTATAEVEEARVESPAAPSTQGEDKKAAQAKTEPLKRKATKAAGKHKTSKKSKK